MPQAQINYIAKNAANALAPLNVDAVGTLISGPGKLSALNVTAASVVKAGAGRVARVVVLGVVGTGGALTINDCATTGAATTANQIFTAAGTVAVGTILQLDFPVTTGIVVSAVPTGGTPQFAISYI